jgi:colanic acid/amylovoran biosynthesis protein
MAAMIELRGAHFRNKGAQLMLIAMVEGLRRIRPDADLVIAPTHRSPYLDRASLGLYQKVWLQKAGIQWGPLISACLPQLFKDAYGLVDDRRVTTVLDASGFAYSDQWGGTHTAELASAADRWVRQGTRLILMPQAFGPFQLRRNRSAMQRVAGMATAIFARDDVSLAHLQSILPAADTDKVRLAPDFTALVASRPCSDWPVPAGGACLIPNKRLIDKRGIGPEQYAALFRSVARMARQADLSPFFLVHEGPEDAALVEAINRSLDSPVPVLAPSARASTGWSAPCRNTSRPSRSAGATSTNSCSRITECPSSRSTWRIRRRSGSSTDLRSCWTRAAAQNFDRVFAPPPRSRSSGSTRCGASSTP